MSVNSKVTVADRLADGPDVDPVATEASRRLHRPQPSQPAFARVVAVYLRASAPPPGPRRANGRACRTVIPSAKSHAESRSAPLLYLDQNYLSGIAKQKPAFGELERALRDAVGRGAVAVAESAVHERESRPRPDLKLL